MMHHVAVAVLLSVVGFGQINGVRHRQVASVASTTVTATITAQSDDAYVFNGSTYNDTSNWQRIGNFSGTQAYNAGFRFGSLAVPHSATIVEAYITFTSLDANSSTTVSVNIVGENTATPDTYSGSGTFNTRAANITTAITTWSPGSWAALTQYNTPSIKLIVQEIVNLAGWTSGNNIGLFILNNGSTSGAYRSPYAYGSTNALHLPILTVTYQ